MRPPKRRACLTFDRAREILCGRRGARHVRPVRARCYAVGPQVWLSLNSSSPKGRRRRRALPRFERKRRNGHKLPWHSEGAPAGFSNNAEGKLGPRASMPPPFEVRGRYKDRHSAVADGTCPEPNSSPPPRCVARAAPSARIKAMWGDVLSLLTLGGLLFPRSRRANGLQVLARGRSGALSSSALLRATTCS